MQLHWGRTPSFETKHHPQHLSKPNQAQLPLDAALFTHQSLLQTVALHRFESINGRWLIFSNLLVPNPYLLFPLPNITL